MFFLLLLLLTDSFKELRLQGQRIVHLYSADTLSFVRYIAGGHQLISNVSYYDAPANISVTDFRIKGINDAVNTMLRTEDWGWHGTFDNEKCFCSSFDRRRGFESYSGPLAFTEDGIKRDFTPLISPLKDLPINGLYLAR